METDRLEERLRGAFDSYEICVISEQTRAFEAAERDLYGREFSEEEGIALRAVKNGQPVFSYTFEKGDRAISALLENTKALLPFMQPDPHYGFPSAFDQYPELNLYDQVGLGVSEEKKIAALLSMEGAILDFDQRIQKTRSCELHENEVRVKIVNSKGMKAEAKKTIYTMGALCVAAEQQEEVSWYDWAWSPRFDGLDGRALGLKIAEKTVSFLGGETLPTGVYDGCLTPAAASDLLSILSSSFLAESLDKDKTRLKGKEGSKFFSELVNIIDSGVIGMGSLPFDGEGAPSQENCLVRQGIFQGFLFDGYYGGKLGKNSTGNSVRTGLKDPPRNGTRGFYIEAGKADLRGLEEGIVIEELMGTHTANGITGDFSLGALGYIYKGGTKKPFKGVMFSGNIFDLLNSVKAVGEDLTFYGTLGSPTLFVEGFKISGT
jgi:PmbA protein